jgi:hypothetical protein
MGEQPTNANSGQGDLFRAYLGSRLAVWFMALASACVFVYGASKRDVLIMTLGPLAAVALTVAVAWVMADRGAANRFYLHYARSLGLVYWPRAGLPALTPLLGAGDRRWIEHWMHGALPGDPKLAGGIGHLVWEEREDDRRDDGLGLREVASRQRVTICVADLEASIRRFHGVFLRSRRGLVAPTSDWIRRSRTREIEVESAAFSQRYELHVADDQDEVSARQLLSPSLIVWLAEHPLAPGFEIRAGMLVVFVDRPLSDEGNLTYLLDATRRLAERVLAETKEAAARPAAVPAP